MSWCAELGVWPTDLTEADDLLVEWKNVAAAVTKSRFANTLAAVELAIPFARGGLPWAKAVLKAWEAVGAVAHHKPLPRLLAMLFGIVLAAVGHARLGAGMII